MIKKPMGRRAAVGLLAALLLLLPFAWAIGPVGHLRLGCYLAAATGSSPGCRRALISEPVRPLP